MVEPDSSVKTLPIILVVDDEPAFCDVVCEILQAAGYAAVSALNAALALELLEDIRPHLILSDVMMPDMDGLSFVRHLRQQPQFQAIPIVIVSAKATPDDRATALSAGANVFLEKPFSSNDLQTLIEDLLDHR